MTNKQENWVEEFEVKTTTYDRDGGFIVYVEDYDNNDFDTDLIKDFFRQTLSTEKAKWMKEWRENIIGMIVKNSTGFDTIGDQRLWHLDIDKFESEFNNLLK